MPDLGPGELTRVRRIPQRAAYDHETIHAILDAGYLCHVAIVEGEQPLAIPTIYARDGDWLYLHGARKSRMLRALAAGEPASITVTHVDGLVLARSAFHHSMNYRSVVVLGRGEELTDEGQRLHALRVLSEQAIPGRWSEVRGPNAGELAQTLVVRFPLAEASAKIRTGPPLDEEEDYALPIWAGEIPLAMHASAPLPDERVVPGLELPPSVRDYRIG